MATKRKRKAATKPKATRPKRERKKKPPVGKPKPTGGGTSRGRTRTRDSQAKVSPKKPARVKPRVPAPKARAAVVKKPKPKLPPLSKHPEAARSRRRRGLARERERVEELKREEQNRKRRERRKARKTPPDEVTLARGWLEMIRERIAQIFAVSMTVTYAAGGSADLTDPDAIELASNSLWLIVGRYDCDETVNYQILARALQHVADDLFIEAAVHPDRLSQLRIVFIDPASGRHASDMVLSKIGAWAFVLGDIVGELVGADFETPTEGSLAAKYQATTVPTFYIFFSREMVRHTTAAPFMKTQEIKLR